MHHALHFSRDGNSVLHTQSSCALQGENGQGSRRESYRALQQAVAQAYSGLRASRIAQIGDACSLGMPPRSATTLPAGLPHAPRQRGLSELETEYASLRRQVKALSRAKDILRSPLSVSFLLQRRAALAFHLSQDPKWGLVYVRLHQKERARSSTRDASEVNVSHIVQWHEHWKRQESFQQSLASKCHPDRIVVDEFLMQSLLYEFVEKQSARGLMVTSSVVIAKYLQMWAYQEKTAPQTRRLEKMQRSATSRWTWCRRFRKFWNLRWGIAPKGVNMTVSTMKRKAGRTEKSTTNESLANTWWPR